MTEPRLVLFAQTLAGLAVMAGVVGWLWSAARARAARWLPDAPGDVVAIASATWVCAIITMSAMLLGAFGALHPLAWAALAAAGGFLLRGRVGTTSRADAGPAGSLTAGSHAEARAAANTGALPSSPDAPSWVFAATLAGVVLGRFLYGLRNPPGDVDSFLYHMPMVAHWIATLGLGAAQLEPQQVGNYYPGNVEILALAFTWPVGRETLMALPGVLSLGLLGLTLRRIAIEAGARPAIAEVLALLLVCAPGVLQLTLGLRVENVMAAWFAVALLFALRAAREGARGDCDAALCALGLLAGCKATGPPLAGFVLALLFVGGSARARLGTLAACRFGLATLLIAGGFWMIRNTIAIGNPFYPATIEIGARTLPGLVSPEYLRPTSQLAVWRAGFAGNLTPLSVWKYFGPMLAPLMAGMLAAAIMWNAGRRARAERATLVLLALVAAAATALTLVQPYSGSVTPMVPGEPLFLSADNVRFLMPTLVALVPLAAVGLSRLPTPAVVLVCAALGIAAGRPYWGHLLPAIALVAVFRAVWTLRLHSLARIPAWRGALALAACVAIAAGVALVEPARARLCDRAWDAIVEQFEGIPSDVARELRDQAAGRPVAVAGMFSIWSFYGRDLRGRPQYVPIGYPLAEARRLWSFAPDPRERADSLLWLRNLNASGAPFVALVARQRFVPIERTWCERDTARFTPVYVTPTRAVYRVAPR